MSHRYCEHGTTRAHFYSVNGGPALTCPGPSPDPSYYEIENTALKAKVKELEQAVANMALASQSPAETVKIEKLIKARIENQRLRSQLEVMELRIKELEYDRASAVHQADDIVRTLNRQLEEQTAETFRAQKARDLNAVAAGRTRAAEAETGKWLEKAAQLKGQCDALQRFKAYVHQRLDEAGIPTHPDGEHSKAGCRVGDRLDIALAMRWKP